MSSLPLTTIPSVMLDFMNEDHREATVMTNKLHALVLDAQEDDGFDRSLITESLIEIYTHDSEHFAREEAEMERTGFPAYGCHKGEHERVLNELQEVLSAWKEGMSPEALENYLTETMTPWFINHINTMDTVTAMFVSRHS